MMIGKLQRIASLRRQKNLPSYMRFIHQQLGFGWVAYDARGVLDRWISLLEHFQIQGE